MNQSAVVQYALEPLAVELREVAVPEIGDDDVLLRVGAVSVCGSDVHQCYNTQSWPVNVPVTLGHEFGGTVAKAGRAVKGFREGDRVVSETAAVVCGPSMAKLDPKGNRNARNPAASRAYAAQIAALESRVVMRWRWSQAIAARLGPRIA